MEIADFHATSRQEVKVGDERGDFNQISLRRSFCVLYRGFSEYRETSALGALSIG
jgi:hypothetical protein